MKRIRLLVVIALILAVLAAPVVIFCIRPPVLIVTDTSFAVLYGKSHLRRQQRDASFALFRRVKPVMVADSAGSDVVDIAIRAAARQPFCVLFAGNRAEIAVRFHEQFPETPVVLFSGLVKTPEIPSPDGFLCVYDVDRPVDLYRAGLCAGILGVVPPKPVKEVEKQDESAAPPPAFTPKTYVLWQDPYVQSAERELFSRGLREQDPESVIIFVNSLAEMPDMKAISCTVLTGAGAEYLGKNPRMPLILFSWLNPDFTAREVVVLFDDSAWALAVPAVRMAVQRQAGGAIPSKPLIFSAKIADNNIFRMLQKSAKKMP
ncbi:MAG: hypothetical protein LBB89_10345 [Treponema sp.]|jgi:hypothetical protein|nr:hypothetical protein [Treponema sp.]